MAAEAPHPKTFKSWEDAFQYPIPTVRRMEQQLRHDINANRERLRTLVGQVTIMKLAFKTKMASYRDLLGTAESIIEMDQEMQQVESTLGIMGKKCNTRLLEKNSSNLRSWETERGAASQERFASISQLAVLRSCPEVISRLLKRNGSVLLAAKVLVISRLLHKKLSGNQRTLTYVDGLRNRLATLRQKLLSAIDQRFKDPSTPVEGLVDAMSAFSLATSSAPVDAVKHFHYMRAEAINFQLESHTDGHTESILALQTFVQTLRETLSITPRHLGDALRKLGAGPLLKGKDVRSLVEFNLDVHESWLGDDIRSFTPYVRHDSLQKQVTEKLLSQWAKVTLGTYLGGLRAVFTSINDLEEIISLRKQILDTWFASHTNVASVDKSEVLDALRDIFNARLTRVIQEKCNSLGQISLSILAILDTWQSSVSKDSISLWDSRMTSMSIQDGGELFKKELVSRNQGRIRAIQPILQKYDEWLDSIDAVERIVKALAESKWEEDIDEIENEEDSLDSRQVLLGTDDPRIITDERANALSQAYSNLQNSIQSTFSTLQGSDNGYKAIFVLRVLRELNSRTPVGYSSGSLGADQIPALQRTVAHMVVETSLSECGSRITKALKMTSVPGRSLWEGDPNLPVLPSAWIFRLLQTVVKTMGGVGNDLWSPDAIRHLKAALRSAVAKEFASPSDESPQTNGDTIKKSSEGDNMSTSPSADAINGATVDPTAIATSEGLEDVITQQLFDLTCLDSATAVENRSDIANQEFSHLLEDFKTKVHIPADLVIQLQKSAEAYWNRVSLLFALLN